MLSHLTYLRALPLPLSTPSGGQERAHRDHGPNHGVHTPGDKGGVGGFLRGGGSHQKRDVVHRNLKRNLTPWAFQTCTSTICGTPTQCCPSSLYVTAAFILNLYGHVTEQMRRDGAAKINRFIEAMEKKQADLNS